MFPQYVTPADVMARLRLPAGHADEAYVTSCTDAANELVYYELERPDLTADIPWSVWRAALGVAIRIYRFKDADSDVSDTWADTGQLRIPRDPIAGYRDMLNPHRPGVAWCPA